MNDILVGKMYSPLNQTNTLKFVQYGDKVIELAIPVEVDIDKFSANDAVMLFAVMQEQLKKLMEMKNECT